VWPSSGGSNFSYFAALFAKQERNNYGSKHKFLQFPLSNTMGVAVFSVNFNDCENISVNTVSAVSFVKQHRQNRLTSMKEDCPLHISVVWPSSGGSNFSYFADFFAKQERNNHGSKHKISTVSPVKQHRQNRLTSMKEKYAGVTTSARYASV
jgi:hypothetical protein